MNRRITAKDRAINEMEMSSKGIPSGNTEVLAKAKNGDESVDDAADQEEERIVMESDLRNEKRSTEQAAEESTEQAKRQPLHIYLHKNIFM